MKKTLIALAALAATGATFAQVTITGNLTSGFSQSVTNVYSGIQTRDPVAVGTITVVPALGGAAQAAARTTVQNTSSGFGVDTAEIIFTAKEDIGGGQTIEAKLGLDNVGRGNVGGNAFGPHDAVLSYTNTSFGRIQLGTTRGTAVHSGIPSAGAPVVDMDGKLFETRSSSDFINYAVPIGPVAVLIQFGEAGNAAFPGNANGIGAGQSGAPGVVKQRSTAIGGLYKDGALEVAGGYKVYDNTNATTIYGPAALTKDSQWQVQVGYDLGVAKLGFGYAYSKASVGPTVADMLVGVNVPMGALEIGATFGQEIVSGVRDAEVSKFSGNPLGVPANVLKPVMGEADGTATGWSIGAKYNMSKRTSFKANYAAWTRSGYEQFEAGANGGGFSAFGYGPIETQANLLLSHSF